MSDKIPLYELTFTTKSNHSLAPRVEYLECKSRELLEKAANQWMSSPYSKYYGYGKVEIYKVTGFSEVISVEIDLDDIIPKKEKQIKKLEGAIIYHTKSIRKAKDQIHKIRGDKTK